MSQNENYFEELLEDLAYYNNRLSALNSDLNDGSNHRRTIDHVKAAICWMPKESKDKIVHFVQGLVNEEVTKMINETSALRKELLTKIKDLIKCQ